MFGCSEDWDGLLVWKGTDLIQEDHQDPEGTRTGRVNALIAVSIRMNMPRAVSGGECERLKHSNVIIP